MNQETLAPSGAETMIRLEKGTIPRRSANTLNRCAPRAETPEHRPATRRRRQAERRQADRLRKRTASEAAWDIHAAECLSQISRFAGVPGVMLGRSTAPVGLSRLSL